MAKSDTVPDKELKQPELDLPEAELTFEAVDFVDVANTMLPTHGIYGVDIMASVCDVLGIQYSKYTDQFGITHLTLIKQALSGWRIDAYKAIASSMMPSNGWDLRFAIIELIEQNGTNYAPQKAIIRVKSLRQKIALSQKDAENAWDLSIYPAFKFGTNDIEWFSIFDIKNVAGGSERTFKSLFGGKGK